MDQLQVTYDRSSGPGGQNVNKVATKVDLRFHVNNANWISDEVKKRLHEDVRICFNIIQLILIDVIIKFIKLLNFLILFIFSLK